MNAIQVDGEKFVQQLQIIFPKVPAWSFTENCSWEIKKTLSKHILIGLRFLNHTSPGIHIIVWSEEETAWLLYSLDKFKQLIETEGLDLVDSLQDILDIFVLFQDKIIVQDVTDIEKVIWPHNRDQLSKYKDTIHSPNYSTNDDEKQVRFWTIEHAHGNLEEWLFIQEGKSIEILSWLREENFVANVGGIG
jgi:hypothetical protein